MTMPDAATWIKALRDSHDRFVAIVSPLDDEAVRAPSYASEWSIADVASHLGSQAVIFGLFLDAGLSGEAAPGLERFKEIWEEWNNRTPSDQVADSVRVNEEFVSRLEGLTDEELATFSLSMFGNDTDLAGLGSMRLGEHALHTWDVAVALDPTAVLTEDAAELLIGNLPGVAARSGKPTADAGTVGVATEAPQRTFVLTTGPEVVLAPGAESEPIDLRLPAEAFIRLVYGRLDPEHSPADLANDPTLDTLRKMFPGF
jgi:uncharacterized protein (TIGR03083 family)